MLVRDSKQEANVPVSTLGGDPNASIEDPWDLVIRPKAGLFNFNIRELIHYRDLVGLMVQRDLASTYKQTVLGWLWFIIQPLMTTLMYMFVFGGIARIGTDDIPQPLFYFCGTMLWTYFSLNLLKCADTFVANSGLFGKIYFPRFTMPLAYIATNALSMGVQFAALLVLYAYYLLTGYTFTPTLWLLAVPVLIIQLGMLGAGIGVAISALTTKYRDLKQLLGFGVALWMYATPVVYPMSQIPGKWRWIADVNPVSAVIETFRFALLGKGTLSLKGLAWSLAATIVFFLLGLIVFNYSERTFVDVV